VYIDYKFNMAINKKTANY